VLDRPRAAVAPLIRPNTVLPARRDAVSIVTSDGLKLIGEWSRPLDRPAAATLVTFHPLPTAGGFMDSHVIRKASLRLPALAGISVLRFNTRGTESPHGRSEGQFDEARSERFDVDAAIETGRAEGAPRLALLGWSFGTDLVLKYGRQHGVDAVVLLSPPLRYTRDEELAVWARPAAEGRPPIPMTVLVPELDDFVRPPEAEERFSAVPQAEVVGVENARHLWVGERYVQQVLDVVVSTALGRAVTLPREWEGGGEEEE
jgi:hypothetical protein